MYSGHNKGTFHSLYTLQIKGKFVRHLAFIMFINSYWKTIHHHGWQNFSMFPCLSTLWKDSRCFIFLIHSFTSAVWSYDLIPRAVCGYTWAKSYISLTKSYITCIRNMDNSQSRGYSGMEITKDISHYKKQQSLCTTAEHHLHDLKYSLVRIQGSHHFVYWEGVGRHF